MASLLLGFGTQHKKMRRCFFISTKPTRDPRALPLFFKTAYGLCRLPFGPFRCYRPCHLPAPSLTRDTGAMAELNVSNNRATGMTGKEGGGILSDMTARNFVPKGLDVSSNCKYVNRDGAGFAEGACRWHQLHRDSIIRTTLRLRD
jgi:hypothetical protein